MNEITETRLVGVEDFRRVELCEHIVVDVRQKFHRLIFNVFEIPVMAMGDELGNPSR